MIEWISSLFGESISPALGAILLFVGAIMLIIILLWIARRILGGTFVAGGRARHLRLAVMDATPVDSRRRLVLVRRDDVEHLILIGGPTDVVVEQNINHAPANAASQRQQPSVFEAQTPDMAKVAQTDVRAASPDVAGMGNPEPVVPPLPQPAPLRRPLADQPAPTPVNRPAPAPYQSSPQPPLPRPTPGPASLAPTRPAPPAVSPAPARPSAAYLAPSSGPAAGIGIAALTTPDMPAVPVEPIRTPVAPPTPVAAPEPMAATVANRSPATRSDLASEPVKTAKAPATEPDAPEIPDPNDSLLLDLSDEIERAASGDLSDQDISLEAEMESLLADLDVKAERST